MRLTNLIIGYNERAVAAVEDCELTPGRLWLVTGPNGCGKTTLLKTLAGLLPPVAGSITPRLPPGQDGAIVVHSAPVMFEGTVRHNLAAAAPNADVEAAADRLELTDWLDRPVRELSHGIRQRTALARAMAAQPRVLLLDEPEGGLDDRARELWAGFVREAWARQHPLIVYAAHRPEPLGVPVTEILLRHAPHP